MSLLDAAAPAAPSTPSQGGTPDPAASGQQAQAQAQPQANSGYVHADGTFHEGWVDRLPEELAGSRETLKKYKNVTELGKAYHNLSQLLGSRANAVAVPGPDATPEQVAVYRKAIGIPESVDQYQFKPAQIPEGVQWNDASARAYAEVAHKLGIPPAAMAALAEVQVAQEAANAQAIHEAQVKALEDARAELQKEYGGKYGQTITSVANLVQQAGIDPASPGFSDPNVIRVLDRIAARLPREDSIPKTASGLQPSSDYKDIMTNPSNPYHQAYLNNDPTVRKMVRDLITQQG